MLDSSRIVPWALFAGLSCFVGCADATEWKLRELPTVADPDGDCQIKSQKDGVEISVPGAVHDLSTALNRMNAPRALCELEGDFSVRVKSDCRANPRTPTIDERKPYQGASLIAVGDDKNFVRLDRAACFEPEDGLVYRYAVIEVHNKSGVAYFTRLIVEKEDDMRYLRLDRAGEKMTAYASGDGKNWSKVGSTNVKLPAKLKVGVAVESTSKEPFKVRFSEFGTAVSAGAAKETK